MSEGAGRPKWLRKTGGEWKWAYDYMRRTSDRGMRTRVMYATRGEPCYEMVADAIAYLQETTDGSEFVTRLRNALRQHRHRTLQAGKNRKPYSFTIPTDTKKTLSINAKKLKITETTLVSDLLNGADKLLEEHRRREQVLRNALDHERKRRMQLDEYWKVKHDEAMRQIERLATLLCMWELSTGKSEPDFEDDEAKLHSETKKMTARIEKAVNEKLRMHELLKPGPI